MTSKHAIVVPVHNAPTYVESLLTQVGEMYPDSRVVVVDDASDNETKAILSRFSAEQVVLSRQQLFTRAANAGIRKACEENIDFVFLVNSDCLLKEEALEKLWEAMDDKTIAIAGYTDSPTLGDEPVTFVQEPAFVTGHCLCLRVRALREIGIFCETDMGGPSTIFRELAAYKGLAHIGGDRELVYRALRKGYNCVYVNFPGVHHEAGKSWEGGSHNLPWLSRFQLNPLWSANDFL